MRKATSPSKTTKQQQAEAGTGMNSQTISTVGGGTAGSLPTTVTSDNHVAQMKTSRNVLLGRFLFVTFLIVVAAVLGTLAWFFLTQSETQLANSKFESIADRALTASTEIVVRKRMGTVTMASVVGNTLRDASEWPFVVVQGYEDIANNLIATSNGRSTGFCPFVTPEDLPEWEAFAYDYYENSREPEPFPNGTGWSSFGKGVWGLDPESDAPDQRYKETDGISTWGSPNKIFAPIFQHSTGPSGSLMFNLHFAEARGIHIDNMIACAETRAQAWQANHSYDIENHECGSLTSMIKLNSQAPEDGPAATIYEPIYPARDDLTLTGMISSTIVWEESLEGVFANDVSGVDCVIKTEGGAFTYTIQNGVPKVKGTGDLHEAEYSSYDWSTEITPSGLFSSQSATYTLEIYPTRAFFVTYSTANPWIASIGAVIIILLTSMLFYVYDYCVRKEFDAKKELLEAKRMFVRFISHEVRTPLNTVCMGLCLLQEEMNAVLSTPPSHSSAVRANTAEDVEQPASPLFASLSKNDSLTAAAAAGNNDVNSPGEQQNVSELLVKSRNISTTADDAITVQREDALDWVNLGQEIYGNAQAAVDVLNDLLNYDKIQMGTLSLEYGVLAPLAQILDKTVIQEFRLMAIEKHVDLQLQIDKDTHGGAEESEDARVIGDYVRVIQVLRNLISNGLKFTPPGGSLTVTMSTTKTETMLPSQKKITSPLYGDFALSNGDNINVRYLGFVTINVMDTGVGMTSQQVDSVFQEGTQFNVNKLQAGNGSGLGMYIAKGIAIQHGGDLGVSSQGLGYGTTFSLTLPLYENPNPPAPTNTAETTASTATEDELGASVPPTPPTPGANAQAPEQHPPLEILVVDDSPSNRKLLMRLLRNRGHKCSEAGDGYDAYNLVKKRMGLTNAETSPAGASFGGPKPFQFDCILLDYEMPVMNGPTACAKMRRIGCSSFIVGVTGNVMPEDVELFKSSGANAVLPKPFKVNALEQLWVEYDVFPETENAAAVTVSASKGVVPELSLRSTHSTTPGTKNSSGETPGLTVVSLATEAQEIELDDAALVHNVDA